MNRASNLTIVLVTHDRQIGESCDRIVQMRDGRIVASEDQAIRLVQVEAAVA